MCLKQKQKNEKESCIVERETGTLIDIPIEKEKGRKG